MPDSDGFIQRAAAAAADKGARSHRDDFIHQAGCQRSPHPGEEKRQPLAFQLNFVNRMFPALRGYAGKRLSVPGAFFSITSLK